MLTSDSITIVDVYLAAVSSKPLTAKTLGPRGRGLTRGIVLTRMVLTCVDHDVTISPSKPLRACTDVSCMEIQ